MGTPAATMGDPTQGQCTHTYASTTPSPAGPVPSPVTMSLPFVGKIVATTATVLIGGKPAAVVGDTVINQAIHPPVGGAPTPGPAAPPPTNQGTIIDGSPTVLIGGKPAARTGSKFQGCTMAGPGQVIGSAGTVLIA